MFTITPPTIESPEDIAKSIVSDRRVYLTDDRETLVEEGSVQASMLLAAKGGRIDAADVARLGLSLVDGRVVQHALAEPEKVEAQPETEKVDGSDAKPGAGKREKK